MKSAARQQNRRFNVQKLQPQAQSWQQSGNTVNDSNDKRATIAGLAEILLGCYRTGDANDPAIYSGAIIAVLSDYSLEVVERVVDPRTGLPSRCKWLPTVAEVKEACEDIERPRRLALQARKQLEERDRLAITDDRPRKTYEQHQAELAAHGIFIGQAKANVRPVDIGRFCEAHGITKEQWDAIPNQKDAR